MRREEDACVLGLGIAVPGPGLPSDSRRRRGTTMEKNGSLDHVYPVTVLYPYTETYM